MKVNEYMKLHDKIARQNRIIYSSSESIAMAMSPSIIELVDNINRMMKVIPPDLIGTANRIAKINSIVSPSLLEMSVRLNETANVISPAIQQFSQQSKQITDILSPTFKIAIQNIERCQIELNLIIQQMAQSWPSWPDINLLATVLTDIIQSNPYLEELKDEKEVLSAQGTIEIENAILEIISEPSNWQQRTLKVFEEIKINNPLLSKVLIGILGVILAIIVGASSSFLADVVKDTWIKKEPTSSAQNITKLEIEQTVYVINDVPYYYEVEFTDGQSGETIKGWVSKRSLRPSVTGEK